MSDLQTPADGEAEPDQAAVPDTASMRVPSKGRLSPMEQTALELVAAGHSKVAAAEAVGRSAKTIQRLLRRPEAQAFLVAAQADRLDQVVGLLGMAPVDAAKVVMDELRGESASTRLRAAALVLGSFDQVGLGPVVQRTCH